MPQASVCRSLSMFVSVCLQGKFSSSEIKAHLISQNQPEGTIKSNKN